MEKTAKAGEKVKTGGEDGFSFVSCPTSSGGPTPSRVSVLGALVYVDSTEYSFLRLWDWFARWQRPVLGTLVRWRVRTGVHPWSKCAGVVGTLTFPSTTGQTIVGSDTTPPLVSDYDLSLL